MNPIFIAIMVVIVLAVAGAMYWMHSNCMGKKVSVEHMKDAKSPTTASVPAPASLGKVLYFSMKNCPYCDKFDADWEDFAGTTKSMGYVSEKHVYYPKETATEKNDALVQKYVTGSDSIVSSFPTILFMEADGTITPYKGSRSVDDLTSALQKMVTRGHDEAHEDNAEAHDDEAHE